MGFRWYGTAMPKDDCHPEVKRSEEEFWSNVRIPRIGNDLNVELEKALRLADFIEIGELMAHDALDREESCGGHFRLEHQTEEEPYVTMIS